MIVGMVLALWIVFRFAQARQTKSYLTTSGEDDAAERFALLELY
jgi:hypothetical protein